VISNGGAVVNSTGYIGFNADSANNSVLVTGAGSTWTSSNDLLVGAEGSSNILVISSGGTVANTYGYIGVATTSINNSVLVTGSNSLWTNSGDLNVGSSGSGNSLVISNGGTVADNSGDIGFDTVSSNNSVLVTGINSLWTNSSNLYVGNYGNSNSLVISNGGMVASSVGYIGVAASSSNNSVLVVEVGSLWTNSSDLYVGVEGGGNSLVINKGGRLEVVGNTFIGYSSTSSSNSVLVTGTGSTWTNSDTLFVGVEGTGNTLTVAEGGTIAAANIVIAASNGSSGTLNVGRFGANGAASTISAPTIAFGAGTGVINFNQSNTVTVSSVISGAGMVNQLGTGWTVLSGANTYTGPTTVSAGTLVAQSQTALGTGAVSLLGGTLELQSQLDIGSLLWDGAAVIAMPGAGNGQFLNVTGLLKLTNGVNNFNLAGAALPRSPVKLLSSTNLPTLSTDDFGVLGLGSYTLSIDGNTLYLTAQDISYQSFAITPNQVSVAKALDTFIGAPGDRGTVSAALDTLAISQYPAAFEQLMPSQYASLPSMVFNVANALNSSLFQRMWAVRSSGRGFSSSGMNLAPMQGEMGGTDDMGVFAINPSKETPWGTFVDGNGVFANASSTGSAQNYRSQSGGVSTGAAYSWNEALATGVYVGYQGLQAEYDSGRTIDNAVRFGVFGTYEVEDFYFNALVGGAYHGYTVSRNIDFGGLDRTATGRPGAGEFNLALGTGYDFQVGDLTFGPFTTLQYTYLGMQGFTETGADALDLDVSPYDSSSMLYTLGAQAAHNWKLSKDVIITPVAFAGWQHEFLQNGYTINSSFATGGPAAPFNYNTSSPARDNFYGGAGVTVSLGERWQATFIYSASAANENNSSQNLYLSAGYKF
jgi:T5SS/PEP-CTERM-associated repeat protein/autotransporter-associated beta strand protein